MTKQHKSGLNGKQSALGIPLPRPASEQVPLPPLLTRRSLAELIGVCEMTIKRWEKAGVIRPLKFNGRVTRYEQCAVEALIKGARVETA